MTTPASHSTLPAGVAARKRIVDAAMRCLVREGVAETSMAAIATDGGVSKALLHYHYKDRATLLAEVVTQLGRRIVARERAAMDVVRGSGAVDALWTWLDEELSSGELRALLELAMQPEPPIRAAANMAATARDRAATQTVEQLFAGLGLTPRMPAPLLAGASVAFMDGLAIGAASSPREARVSFDLFWLALLSLAE
ncbi:MAG: TetR/AcrR family transcriptional regulator [Gemmatimonadota bacterium]|nr:TetR/AcrR family transcriptional regulator [Gemmatimonadota bacterium]